MADTDVLTVQEAKEILNMVNSMSSAELEELPGWVSAVSERLDILVGPVVRREVTDFLEGGTGNVFVNHYPVTSFTEVKSDGVAVADYKASRYSRDTRLFGGRLEGEWGDEVEVTYIAGRFANTAAVAERYKKAAGFMLMNLYRSQRETRNAQYADFETPGVTFPRWAVPRVVSELLAGEIQLQVHVGGV